MDGVKISCSRGGASIFGQVSIPKKRSFTGGRQRGKFPPNSEPLLYICRSCANEQGTKEVKSRKISPLDLSLINCD